MGFLDRLKNSQKNELHPNWKVLDSEEQLKSIINGSHEKPAMIFKHSTTCGISAGARHRLESGWDIDPNKMDFYYLDLLNHRPISNLIAQTLDVIHESPQIVLIKNGEAVYNASHHAIDPGVIKTALNG